MAVSCHAQWNHVYSLGVVHKLRHAKRGGKGVRPIVTGGGGGLRWRDVTFFIQIHCPAWVTLLFYDMVTVYFSAHK